MSAQHIVQFYGTDSNALAGGLSRYIAEGLEAGESVILILNRGVQPVVFAALETLCGGADYREDGRLTTLDSARVLEAILTPAGSLDGTRFDKFVGSLVRDAAARSRTHGVRVYGDLVDVLWRSGRRADAVELERWWNDLQKQVPFQLYCGYGIDVFGNEFQTETAAPVLAEHSGVIRSNVRAITGAIDYAAYETLGHTCPDLPGAEATVLWLREHAPERAREILERAKRYAGD